MRSNAEFASDLEDVLVRAGLHHRVPAADSLGHVATAVGERTTSSRPGCPVCYRSSRAMKTTRSLRARPRSAIPWGEDLDMLLNSAER